MVEAICGAAEADEHNLRTRLRKREHRVKWAIILAIGWNLRVENTLRCAKLLGMEVTPIAGN